MKLYCLSILIVLFAVLLALTSPTEQERQRRQLDASPTVLRARLRRPLVIRNSISQPFGRPPVRYYAYINSPAIRPSVIRVARPVINNQRRYMKFDYEHPDHFHIYHS